MKLLVFLVGVISLVAAKPSSTPNPPGLPNSCSDCVRRDKNCNVCARDCPYDLPPPGSSSQQRMACLGCLNTHACIVPCSLICSTSTDRLNLPSYKSDHDSHPILTTGENKDILPSYPRSETREDEEMVQKVDCLLRGNPTTSCIQCLMSSDGNCHNCINYCHSISTQYPSCESCLQHEKHCLDCSYFCSGLWALLGSQDKQVDRLGYQHRLFSGPAALHGGRRFNDVPAGEKGFSEILGEKDMLERGLHYLPGERRSYDLPTRERELEDEVEWLYGEDAKEPPQLANYPPLYECFINEGCQEGIGIAIVEDPHICCDIVYNPYPMYVRRIEDGPFGSCLKIDC